MVHWIYVLECEDKHLYVGETTRLFRRFSEHLSGRGAMNTHNNSPETLIGLYKVADNYSFLQYRNSILQNTYDEFFIKHWGTDEPALEIENHFTEMYMYQRAAMEDDDFWFSDGQWQKVKGGKYTKYLTANPTEKMNPQSILDRPNCKCQVPSEVKISKDRNTIYFVCSLKNVWDEFYRYLEVGEPCDFYSVYTDDKMIKAEYTIAKKKIGEEWCRNIPATSVDIGPEPCVLCKTEEYTPFYSWYKHRRVCVGCILNRYEELKKGYSYNDYAFVD